MTKEFSVGLYCRLSSDDGTIGESGSIQTQKMILEKYCNDNNFKVKDIYVDDGYSGLNFNRPGFVKLLNDVEQRKINLVITKDLSRLGRDYIQTGYYTEVYFPSKGVRYIAVNDGIDTSKDNNDIAPFKNILNDMYAKDLSRKVKAAKHQRAMNGLYISSQAPYGYKKDPNNKNQLIVDEEASLIVKKIYDLYLSGLGTPLIAKRLESEKVLTPSAYKVKNGDTRFLRHVNKRNNDYGWITVTINQILRNKVYVGDLENFKYEVLNYKTKRRTRVPSEKRVCIPNTHEAIISRYDFDQVQMMMKTKYYPSHIEHENIFKSKIFCSGCKRRMQIAYHKLKDDKLSAYYKCAHHFKYRDECTQSNIIYYDVLKKIVIERLKDLITKVNNNDFIQVELKARIASNSHNVELVKEKKKYESRLNNLTKIIKKLYEDNSLGLIDDSTYQELLKEYVNEKKELSDKVSIIKIDNNNISDKLKNFKKLEEEINSIFKGKDVKNLELTNKLVNDLISRIEVGYKEKVKGKITRKITIVYKYIEMEV